MKNTTYERYYLNLFSAFRRMNESADSKNLTANNRNYGIAITLVDVLRDFGHEVELPVYLDGEYLRADRLKIDGTTF